MKHLLLTTALIAAGAAGSATAEAHMSESPFATEIKEGQVHASDFIGMRVYAAAESGEMTEVEGVGDNWEDIVKSTTSSCPVTARSRTCWSTLAASLEWASVRLL
jgi:hypothetical protein